MESRGFDAMVGNPPFLGGKRISAPMGSDYREHLVRGSRWHQGQRRSASTYFFLRAAYRSSGGFGFLATNTISQGDTREVGLDRLVADGWVDPSGQQVGTLAGREFTGGLPRCGCDEALERPSASSAALPCPPSPRRWTHPVERPGSPTVWRPTPSSRFQGCSLASMTSDSFSTDHEAEELLAG